MPGKIVHFELPAQDDERGRAFWSGLFGWEFQSAEIEGMAYWLTQAGGEPAGALYPSDELAGRGPIVYFDTDDIGASVARVRELGGEADDAAPIPRIGWFARCRDSEGNAFSLFQGDEGAGT
jgi:uncharacterized protein